MTYDKVLRKLTAVLVDGIGDVFLLQEQVTRIGAVPKDTRGVGILPAASDPRGDALGGKLPLGLQPGFPIGEVLEPHDRRLIRDDDKLIALPFIPVDAEFPVGDALLEAFSRASFHILGDAAAFFLRKRSEDGEHQFSVPAE